MKTLMRLCFVFSFVLLINLSVSAQEGTFSHSLTIGLGQPILDTGVGYHIGYNPAYKVAPIFSLEGQASYIRSRINGTFLSGRIGRGNALNLLVGGRLYLLSEDRNIRPYLSLLIGGQYYQEILDGLKQDFAWDLGFSAGVFVSIHHFVVGLSLDTPQHLTLKLGYWL